MKTKSLLFFIIFAAGVLFPLACYSQESAQSSVSAEAENGISEQGPNRGLLYRVSGGGLERPSYIFGTHHMAPLSLLESIAGYEDAFAASDAIVGELVMGDLQQLQQAMMPHMTLAEGTTYRDMLSEEDYAILDEGLIRDLGAGLEQLGSMHPAALSMLYTVTLYAKHIPDYSATQTSLDQHFQLRGAEEGKSVTGLETVEDQINAMFYTEPVEVMAKALVETVKNPEYTVGIVNDMTKYYVEHDLDGLYRVSFDNPDDPFEMEGFERALVKERNDKWMAKLPALMSARPVFVAVGAGHLAGPDGILTQLRKAGYDVEPVN